MSSLARDKKNVLLELLVLFIQLLIFNFIPMEWMGKSDLLRFFSPFQYNHRNTKYMLHSITCVYNGYNPTVVANTSLDVKIEKKEAYVNSFKLKISLASLFTLELKIDLYTLRLAFHLVLRPYLSIANATTIRSILLWIFWTFSICPCRTISISRGR